MTEFQTRKIPCLGTNKTLAFLFISLLFLPFQACLFFFLFCSFPAFTHTPHTSTHLSFRILCFPGKKHKVYSSICSQHACWTTVTTCHVSLSPAFPLKDYNAPVIRFSHWRLRYDFADLPPSCFAAS